MPEFPVAEMSLELISHELNTISNRLIELSSLLHKHSANINSKTKQTTLDDFIGEEHGGKKENRR